MTGKNIFSGRKTFDVLCRVLVLCLLCFLMIPAKTHGVNAEAGWQEIAVTDGTLGSGFAVPERNFIKPDGTPVRAVPTVVFPDGSITASTRFTLDEAGYYTVRYTAVLNGVPCVKEEKFRVGYPLCTYRNPDTEAVYGAHELAPGINGLKVRLMAGDILEFSQIIDLNDATKDDVLFEFFVTADNPGTYDFHKLFFRFTDTEDPDRYITVRAIHSNDGIQHTVSYLLAGGDGQILEGWENLGPGKLHKNNKWGTAVKHSWASMYGGSSAGTGKSKLTFYYDNSEKSIYANGQRIIDFDSPEFYDDLWGGFKSGKVKLSIWADEIYTVSANFVITKVMGIDLLSSETLDCEAPVITAEEGFSPENMPPAKLGMPYRIPSVKAYDGYSGDCAVTAKVYYNKTDLKSFASVPVEDGSFVPRHPGAYTIEYTASDRMGNVAKKVYGVRTCADIPVPEVRLPQDKKTEAKKGENVEVKPPEVISYSGGYTVKTEVLHDGKREEIEGGFRPLSAGTWTVVYTASDYIGQKTEKSYDVSVTESEEPLFNDEPRLPKYAVAGCPIDIPDYYADDYSGDEPKRIRAEKKVKDSRGEKVLRQGEKWTPRTENNFDEAKVTYSIGKKSLEGKIRIVRAHTSEGDAGNLKIANYFYCFDNCLQVENLADYSAVKVKKDGDAAWEFANTLLSENFTLTIGAVPGKSYFDGIKIELKDSLNPDETIAVEIMKDGEKSVIKACGKALASDAGFEANSKLKKFTVNFRGGKFDIAKIKINADRTPDGRKFTGFSSGKAYLKVTALNAAAGAQYSIYEINGQNITDVSDDYIAPGITVLKSVGRAFRKGETVTLSRAVAGDVLDTNIDFTLSVTAPSLKPAEDINGNVLRGVDPSEEWSLKLDSYGIYNVVYVAKDTYQSKRYAFVIMVEDDAPPVIEFTQRFQETAKVGDCLVIPDFTVKDAVTDEADIVVNKYLLTPDGSLLYIPENSNSVRVKTEGVYQFRITAADKAGNIAICRKNITVTR